MTNIYLLIARGSLASGKQGLSNLQMTRAFLVLKQLLKQGLVPNQRTFMPLIDVCGRVGKVDRAFSLLTEMKGRGLTPNCDIYTRLMEACSQSGVPEQAFGVFKQMMVSLTLVFRQVTTR